MSSIKAVVLVFIVIVGFVLAYKVKNNDVACRDENNNFVDWFYLYKLPKNKFGKTKNVQVGSAYMFITPDTLKKGWTLSTKSINDSSSMPGLTLNTLYQNKISFEDQLVVIYNDQPFVEKSETSDDNVVTKRPSKPKLQKSKSVKKRSVERQNSNPENRKIKNGKNSGNGHTKGVVLGNDKTGFWLIHSAPKYPPIPDGVNKNSVRYSYPDNALKFGQSFLCISLRSSSLNTVGQQLKFNEPKVLFSNVPNSLHEKVPNIMDVINRKTVAEAPWSNVVNLTSIKDTQFLSFAKASNFKKDLYDGLVAPSLRSSLYVESWVNGAGVLDSNCSIKYKVNNIEKIAFHDKGIAFSSHNDHSKWAVTDMQNKKGNGDNWICVGDINRAETQELRGGGTVCLRNKDLWNVYTESINEVEPCKKPQNGTESLFLKVIYN